MALASAGSLGPVLVYLLGAPRAPHADPGPGWVLSSVSPGGGADAGEVVLAADSTRESRDFLGTIVAEIQVYTKRAIICYTIPISQSTPKTELLLGGRSEKFRVGNEAEASSHLVWDVEGGLHPEEQPRVGLWLSEQFLLPADVFLQSFSSTPTVRPRQHVAICLGNAVRELAVPAQVSGLW